VTFGGHSLDQLVIRKLRASDRAVLWTVTWTADRGVQLRPTHLSVSAAGTVFAGFDTACDFAAGPCDRDGFDPGGGRVRRAVVKLDANGTYEWQKPASFLRGGDLSVDASGRVALSGGGEPFAVFGPDGTQLWESEVTHVSRLAFAPDGSLYVAWGRSEFANSTLTRFDGAGRVLWTRDLDRPVYQLATSGRNTLVVLSHEELAAYEAVDGAERFRIRTVAGNGLAVQPGGHAVTRVSVVGGEGSDCRSLVVKTYDELHDIRIGRETLRKWLVSAGLWTTRRERIRKAHQPRRRRDCLGELVQIDGCEHAWFRKMTIVSRLAKKGRFPVQMSFSEDGCTERQKPTAL
jgi:hypothetical protein